ncbi:hypothetical protein C8Q74DRAFT_1459850 [Fomes fomentarius]|nr:hypothetical protein C8Q74DRAFT_1459850 [Fomes fomentarius]
MRLITFVQGSSFSSIPFSPRISPTMPIPALQRALGSFVNHSKTYGINTGGVAGFFGGDVAVAAMGTIHIYRGRKWFGWYNSPGSYEIAKSYGILCKSRLWDGLYPGVNVDPAVLFHLDGKSGPSYHGMHSGTRIAQTGHLGYLLAKECRELEGKEAKYTVTVDPEMRPTLSRAAYTYLAFLPIFTTVLTAVMCVAAADDWFCFALILYGAIASGVSCLVIGSGQLRVNHPVAAQGAPRGDGVLGADGSELILPIGEEAAVNTVTRGAFSLKFSGHPQYHLIGVCAALLTIQFLAQLLVIPLGTPFGQVMFLISLMASWIYTTYLSSIDHESLQRKIINNMLNDPKKTKYGFQSRTAMSVFVLLVLQFHSSVLPTEELQARLGKVLDILLPNDTRVWTIWKKIVLQHVAARSRPPSLHGTSQHGSRSSTCCAHSRYEPSIGASTTLYDLSLHQESLDPSFDPSERQLLRELISYAQHAFRMYKEANPMGQVYVLKLA